MPVVTLAEQASRFHVRLTTEAFKEANGAVRLDVAYDRRKEAAPSAPANSVNEFGLTKVQLPEQAT